MTAWRLEAIAILMVVLMLLSAAGLWLWTEWAHRREAALVERVLTGKPLHEQALIRELTEFSSPCREILPGKHLFYESTLASAAADLVDISPSIRLQWIDQARKALPEALAREPAHTHAWVQLAHAEWLFNGPNRKSIDALRMSIYTSPADRQVLIWRLKLAGLNRVFWDEGFQGLVTEQIAVAWQFKPKALAKMSTPYHIDDLVRQSLSSNSEDLSRFETLVAR